MALATMDRQAQQWAEQMQVELGVEPRPDHRNDRPPGICRGRLLTGSLLDYALPTASMIPAPEILHQPPSPVTPLGAKGVAEGNSMSTPVCIANAVADALGVADLELPLTAPRVLALVKAAGQ